MAKLTDPDSLSVYVEVTDDSGASTEEVIILTGPKTIELVPDVGNLDDDAPGKTSGVTAKALYSFLKEQWVLSTTPGPTLRRFKFPLKMIFEGSFIWQNGWAPANDQTRDLIRDAGFEEQVSGDVSACMISLGAIHAPASDLAYYIQSQSHTATTAPYDKTGELDENVDITGATTYFKSFMRVQGKTYAEYELLQEQGLASITFQAYSFPLVNIVDNKISATDNDIDTTTPYTDMEINFIKGSGFTTWAVDTVYPAGAVVLDPLTNSDGSTLGKWWFTPAGGTSGAADTGTGDDSGVTDWEAYFGQEQIGAEWYAFNREVDAGGGTDIEAHEFMSRQLRQTGDINDDTGISANQGTFGAVNGTVAQLLSTYVGDTLLLKPGVVLRNFDTNSTNNIKHQPITVDTSGLDDNDVPLASSEVSFPFVAAGRFVFSQNFIDEVDATTAYTVYFDYTKLHSAATIGATFDTGLIADFADSGSGFVIEAGDYFYVTGFVDTTLNGLWKETGGSPTSSAVTATKQDGQTPGTEAEGATVTIKVNPYESPGAVIVNDNSGTAMNGLITPDADNYINWDYDYTNNDQRGAASTETDADCTIVAIAEDGAEWIDAQFTISQGTGINVPVNGGDERNYENA